MALAPARYRRRAMWWDRGDSLDYVVFGIGFGATLLVLGLLVRDIGPRLRYRAPSAPEGVFHAEELVAKVAWSRFCGALGSVLAIGGALFVLVTVVCMLIMLSDRTGGYVMAASLAVLVLLVAFWTWAYFDRFGSYGILPERQQAPSRQPPPADPGSDDESDEPASTSYVVPDSDRDGEDEPERGEGGRQVRDRDVVTDVGNDETADDEVADLAEQTTTEEEDDISPEPSDEEPEEPQQKRLQTPEERLASAEAPIDHGSVEDELDIAPESHRRPPQRNRPRRPEAKEPSDARADSDEPESLDSDTANDSNSASEPDQRDT